MVKKSCFMFSVILFPIYVGATSFTSNVTGGTVTSNLSMTVKASCSTTVGDVTFGDQSAGDIKKGAVAEKVISLAIVCDTIKVKPVALGETVSPGAANTALNIKLTFN